MANYPELVTVVCARWDSVRDSQFSLRSCKLCFNFRSSDDLKQRRIPIIAYTAPFEMRDCTNLESCQQSLHINTSRNTAMEQAWVRNGRDRQYVRPLSLKEAKDGFRGDKPLNRNFVCFSTQVYIFT
jgi:hypothetical protein